MKKTGHVITRRDFIRHSARASLAVAAGMPLQALYQSAGRKAGSEVVVVRNSQVVDSRRRIDSQILGRMLDEAIMTLTGKPAALEAWRSIFTPRDVVGIKSNSWGPLPTPRELEELVSARLRDCGLPETGFSVDDRGVLTNSVFLNSTALVNMRPLRTHHWAGVGGCLKNYIMFTARPSNYHPDSCAGLGDLWKLPLVKAKTRLNILVMLTPLFHGIGPHHWDLKYTWPYGGLIVGKDPVAVDAVGLRILEAHRQSFFGKVKPLWPPASHIGLADTRFGIGNADPARIRIVKLGWEEGSYLD